MSSLPLSIFSSVTLHLPSCPSCSCLLCLSSLNFPSFLLLPPQDSARSNPFHEITWCELFTVNKTTTERNVREIVHYLKNWVHVPDILWSLVLPLQLPLCQIPGLMAHRLQEQNMVDMADSLLFGLWLSYLYPTHAALATIGLPIGLQAGLRIGKLFYLMVSPENQLKMLSNQLLMFGHWLQLGCWVLTAEWVLTNSATLLSAGVGLKLESQTIFWYFLKWVGILTITFDQQV